MHTYMHPYCVHTEREREREEEEEEQQTVGVSVICVWTSFTSNTWYLLESPRQVTTLLSWGALYLHKSAEGYPKS